MARTEGYVVFYRRMIMARKSFRNPADAAKFADARMRDGSYETIRHVVQNEVTLPSLLNKRKRAS